MAVNTTRKSSLPGALIFMLFVIAIPLLSIKFLTKSSSSKEIQTEEISETSSSLSEEGTEEISVSEKEIFQESGYSKNSKGMYILTSPVMDTAKILSESEYSELEKFLLELDSSTGIQIVVFTVDSLEDKAIEEFSMEYAEFWALGQKDKDNGVLLTVAMQDHKVRIETGYGSEGALTDALCSKIIRKELYPSFQAEEYGKGIITAVHDMAGILSNDESLISTSLTEEKSSAPSAGLTAFIIFAGIWLFFLVIAITKGSRGGGSRSGRSNHSSSWGGFSGGSHFGGGGGSHFGGGGGHFGGGGASGGW